jgi:hypothetical protein
MTLFPHQLAAYKELRRTADAFFFKPWQDLPVRPRFNRLVVGPSGTGKTHLARCLASECSVPYLELCATNWIPLGASERGARPSWLDVADFCYAHPQGIICLDEIDKCGERSPWMTYLRVEIFSLLDRRCPANLIWRPDEAELDDGSVGQARIKVAKHLDGGMLLVGAGAFQDLWDAQREAAGFHSRATAKAAAHTLSHQTMAQVIPVEILNRFVSPVLAIPRLEERDYLAIVKALARELKPQDRPRVRRLAQNTLELAVEQGLGSRWAEQLLLELVTSSRSLPKPRAGSVVWPAAGPEMVEAQQESDGPGQ